MIPDPFMQSQCQRGRMLTCEQEVPTSGLAARQPGKQRDLEKNLRGKKKQSKALQNIIWEQSRGISRISEQCR